MTDNAWDRADPRIGQYVRRTYDVTDADGRVAEYAMTLNHLTESLIDDEPVTRCGRRLRQREGTSFRFEATPARRVCKRCSGG